MRKAALTEAQIRKHLADNLSYLRQAKTPKLSQKAVARILNLPPKTIMNYENANSCTMEELLTKNLRKERKNIT